MFFKVSNGNRICVEFRGETVAFGCKKTEKYVKLAIMDFCFRFLFFDWKTRETTSRRVHIIRFLIYVMSFIGKLVKSQEYVYLSENRPERKLAMNFLFRFCFLLDLIDHFFGKTHETTRCWFIFSNQSVYKSELYFRFRFVYQISFFIGKIVKLQDYVYQKGRCTN